jgi:uncharacterized protein (TIGR00297 family)
MRLTLAPLTNFDIGAVAAALIGFVAWRLNALDPGGAVAAFFVGTATFGGLGGEGSAILIAFFVTSVGLSRFGKAAKVVRLIDIGKAGPRDAAQVLANGGVAAVCALLAFWIAPRYAVAFAGALGAATADTWGTEIGTLVAQVPRSILTWRPVATGLSGGVTAAGTLAEFGGALLIAGVAAGFGLAFWPVLAGGVAGALADSILGASLQALRWCPQCRRACETDPHHCGATTEPIRGFGWFGNDNVNFAATLSGALVAFSLVR